MESKMMEAIPKLLLIPFVVRGRGAGNPRPESGILFDVWYWAWACQNIAKIIKRAQLVVFKSKKIYLLDYMGQNLYSRPMVIVWDLCLILKHTREKKTPAVPLSIVSRNSDLNNSESSALFPKR